MGRVDQTLRKELPCLYSILYPSWRPVNPLFMLFSDTVLRCCPFGLFKMKLRLDSPSQDRNIIIHFMESDKLLRKQAYLIDNQDTEWIQSEVG